MAPSPKTTWSTTHDKQPAVVIIGAGISGICAAIDLIRFNNSRDFVIIEKGNQVGGTWNDNKYPGCCCDVWSHLYSLSFAPNPNWSREYPGQEEIHQYLIDTAQKWGLYQHIRFNSVVSKAEWQDEGCKWRTTVEVSGGKAAEFGSSYVLHSEYLMSGIGQLNQPYTPEIEGLSDFKGVAMHSARWDWNQQLKSKRIALIGNGATAAQIVPELAVVAKNLTVFQRTPNWVVPRDDQYITGTRKAIYRHIPMARRWYRASLMDAREGFYDAAVVENSELNKSIIGANHDMMKSQLANKPELAAKLTPNYPPGCKRIIISDDYYPALDRANVHLELGSIEKITANGIVADGKELPFDVIVFATGFRTQSFLEAIDITGTQGRKLKGDVWKNNPQAYLGVTVPSLPNFAMLFGPNTNLGHNSIILMIEAQSRYIAKMVSEVLRARQRDKTLAIMPRTAKVEAFNKELQDRLSKSTFASSQCNSWYKNADGSITTNWSGNVIEYQKLLSTVEWENFVISGSAASGFDRKQSYVGRVVEESQGLVSLAGKSAVLMALTGVAASMLLANSRFTHMLTGSS